MGARSLASRSGPSEGQVCLCERLLLPPAVLSDHSGGKQRKSFSQRSDCSYPDSGSVASSLTTGLKKNGEMLHLL